MSTTTTPATPPATLGQRGAASLVAIGRRVPASGAILLVFIVLVAWITYLNPTFIDPPVFLNFLRRSSPLMLLAIGQMFVVAAGGLDLSVGSIVTLTVVVSARFIDDDPSVSRALMTMLLVCALGVLIGSINGFVVTKLKVPSFIATLGMLLIVAGGVDYWSGGAPRGALSDAMRAFGRDAWDLPVLGQLPYAVIVVIIVGVIAAWMMQRLTFGRHVIAVGGGARTARLSGVAVRRTRVLTFVISGLMAAFAGILLAGIAGVSAQVGAGMEFRAITAVVLGGAAIGGGRGSVLGAAIGALTLDAVFTLLNLLGFSVGIRLTVQGVLIIAAVTVEAARQRERI